MNLTIMVQPKAQVPCPKCQCGGGQGNLSLCHLANSELVYYTDLSILGAIFTLPDHLRRDAPLLPRRLAYIVLSSSRGFKTPFDLSTE